MAGCIGMTTEVEERVNDWAGQEGYTDYQILGENLTYDEATNLEELKRRELQAQGHLGGQYVPGRVWSVYYLFNP